MNIRRSLLRAAFCAAVLMVLPLNAKAAPFWYQPQYLSSVDDASNRLQFLSPHFAPLMAGGLMTNGYSLGHVDSNKLGINLDFTKSGVVKGKKYDWSPWLGLYDVPTSTPYKDDIVTTIVFADVSFFELLHTDAGKLFPATWCVKAISRGPERNSAVCLPTEADAHSFIDAIATLVVANGGRLRTPIGMSYVAMSKKDLEDHPERAGLRVTSVFPGSPAAQAGVLEKDIILAVNRTPCTRTDALAIPVEAAVLMPGGGEVDLELLQKGANLSLDLHYPYAGVDAAQLRAQLAGQTQHGTAAPAIIPGAAPAGPHLGIRLRAATQADSAVLGFPRTQGVVVTSIEKGGLADEMQMQIDDVIVAVNGSEIADVDFFVQFFHSGAAKSLRVLRKGQTMDLTVPQSM
jgi:hypothetical protein